jgi:type 1 glutamine amidotransferase
MLENLSAIALYSNPGGHYASQEKKEHHLFAPSHTEAAEALVKSGVGLAALHWGTGTGDPQETWDKLINHLGGAFGMWSRFVFSESRIKQLDPQHPICRGWSDFDLEDEWYLNMREKDDIKPLAQVRYEFTEGPDKGKIVDQVVMWTYERKDSNGGRSFANTLGHYHGNFQRERFRKTMLNGILWAARCEVPPNGAPCKFDKWEDFDLGGVGPFPVAKQS